MAKPNAFTDSVQQHLRTVEKAPDNAPKALGLPWWIPKWAVAQAIAVGLAALRAIAKTDAAKAEMEDAFLLLFQGIRLTYVDSDKFNCD